MALLANNLIMTGRSLRSFRHLEHQNLSIISENIGRARMVQQFRRIAGGVGLDGSTVDAMSDPIISKRDDRHKSNNIGFTFH